MSIDTVEKKLGFYLNRALTEPLCQEIQHSPLTTEPWGQVLSQFTRDLTIRLEKAKDPDSMSHLVGPLVTRGVELVSGGVVSGKDLAEGERRGICKGGSWSDAPEAHFWDPRVQRGEQKWIYNLIPEILALDTDASETHVGRVVTMSFPALISWADLRAELTPQAELVTAIQRLLESEKTGKIEVVSFGCEPYQYRYEPNTTTRHFRRSEFGCEPFLRRDIINGAFRGVRKILEPVALSGVKVRYDFYTSFGTNWELIQRQVMPDTINFYKSHKSPEEMLGILRGWKDTIAGIGQAEFAGSGLELSFQEMESSVVLPALRRLGQVLRDCGMKMPDDQDHFCYNSDKWFAEHCDELNLLTVIQNHPDPRLLVDFLINENGWSRKHPEAYQSEHERRVQSALLSFFEQHQYERINEVINSADLALGVEIDEELIMLIRGRAREEGREQTPHIWGRPPRYTDDGIPGGVGHRQPWFYG